MPPATVKPRAEGRAARTRVFLESRVAPGERFELPVSEAHHIFKVLRAREGEAVEVVTPDESLMLAEVHGDARRAEAEVLEELSLPDVRRTRMTLYQAVPKGRHMDLVVEKATELGAERIVPLLTEHGEVEPGVDKLDRWRRLAEAAARQSLQLRVPEVSEPEWFREALEGLPEETAPLVLHNGPGLAPLEDCVSETRRVCLFVGPEGGWSGSELSLAVESGSRIAQLGPYRLRSETAGVVAAARAEARLRALADEREREAT